MNLADMLSYADIGQLSRIATTYQCECNGNSKNELIQSILTTVNRREVFEAKINAMKLEDLRFINSLLFDVRDTFSLEELIARVQQSKFGVLEEHELTSSEQAVSNKTGVKKSKKNVKSIKAEQPEPGPRDTIARFKQYGWLFNGYSGSNRYLFQVPTDLKERFKSVMERRFHDEVSYADSDPEVYRDEQTLMGNDVLQLLHYIHHNDIPLTAESVMYRRSILQILELFGVKEQLPSRGEWRFGYGRRIKDYPNRLALIYDYCYYNGWIEETGSSLTLTKLGKERQALPTPEQPDKLYQFWIRLYRGAIPNIRSLVYWIDKLSARWVTADTLTIALSPYIKPYYYDLPETILEQRLIGMMMHLGILRIGEHSEKRQVIRMTPIGRSIVAGLSIEDDTIILNG